MGGLIYTASATTADGFIIAQMSVDILPDEALLEIFSFHLEEAKHIEPWIPLVHVCRRWRSIVFTSPCRLNLRVYLIPRKRQVKVMLDIWPNLPIHILALGYPTPLCNSENNLLAALGLTDRICRIQMDGSRSDLERILPAMQRPFPALTGINIKCLDYIHRRTITVLPEAFLGGSAQHLRSCDLWAVEFPGIWKLLSTANHLVTLNLWYIPHSMSAPPERMATHLSTMPNLESLSIVFRPPQSLRNWPDQPIRRHPSPLTRVVLPSLSKFRFQAMGWYIEDFVSRIDVPLLNKVDITFLINRHSTPHNSMAFSVVLKGSKHTVKEVWYLGVPPSSLNSNPDPSPASWQSYAKG